MTFDVGDLVVHPHRGAGTVVDIENLRCLGSGKKYYAIELFDDAKTRVWVPTKDADSGDLRAPITQGELQGVWRVLEDVPEKLPSDHNKRYQIVEEKLRTGDVLQIAAVLRDLYWKDYSVRSLTSQGKRLYHRGMELLASEVAVVEHSSLDNARDKITDLLRENASKMAA